eukprot:gnl/MRDRNA2_/MRDRNA2_70685_c0_seq1.p1 gnl/MRDRNA2_/MRDRNA2_70685_c0~~gnl/MRDRNA2_/MRDRNA2_70685_c0_seq1.p1  ORF type:complete len:496 (-),score=128.13 gnl/MRDRNA2_/MRDRNA2_70685_c0_seq1:31-1518(-)
MEACGIRKLHVPVMIVLFVFVSVMLLVAALYRDREKGQKLKRYTDVKENESRPVPGDSVVMIQVDDASKSKNKISLKSKQWVPEQISKSKKFKKQKSAEAPEQVDEDQAASEQVEEDQDLVDLEKEYREVEKWSSQFVEASRGWKHNFAREHQMETQEAWVARVADWAASVEEISKRATSVSNRFITATFGIPTAKVAKRHADNAARWASKAAACASRAAKAAKEVPEHMNEQQRACLTGGKIKPQKGEFKFMETVPPNVKQARSHAAAATKWAESAKRWAEQAIEAAKGNTGLMPKGTKPKPRAGTSPEAEEKRKVLKDQLRARIEQNKLNSTKASAADEGGIQTPKAKTINEGKVEVSKPKRTLEAQKHVPNHQDEAEPQRKKQKKKIKRSTESAKTKPESERPNREAVKTAETEEQQGKPKAMSRAASKSRKHATKLLIHAASDVSSKFVWVLIGMFAGSAFTLTIVFGEQAINPFQPASTKQKLMGNFMSI